MKIRKLQAHRTPMEENTRTAANTPDLIVGTLRNAIIQGRYKANEPLRQDQIAKDLGVSKIPLREALVQLKAEGLVVFLPKRGAVVSSLSAAEVAEIYTMRIALETVALEKAMPKLGRADLIRARSVLDIMDGEHDQGQWGELNWEFHANLYKAAEMPMLLRTIHALHNNVTRYLVIYLDRLAGWDRSGREHREILAACAHRDIDTAKTVLTHHLNLASETLVSYFVD